MRVPISRNVPRPAGSILYTLPAFHGPYSEREIPRSGNKRTSKQMNIELRKSGNIKQKSHIRNTNLYIEVRGFPERDISSLGAMELGPAGWDFFLGTSS